MSQAVDTKSSPTADGLTRRTVLRGAAGAAILVGAPTTALARVATGTPSASRCATSAYAFTVARAMLHPDGAEPVSAIVANGALPGPGIRAREGDVLRVLVENQLPDAPTSIHWHGLLVPMGMDGVPDVSNAPIAAARTYVYEFPLRQSGTYWYHSHVGFQEQLGCYGALIIEPAHEVAPADRDAVVVLGDWLHRSPSDVFAALRSGTPETELRTPRPMAGMNSTAGPSMASMPNAMPSTADLSDVRYDAFLMNGRGSAEPWSLSVRRGDRVRLRIINGAGSTYFRVLLDDYPLEVTHADGVAVVPVRVDQLLMGMGETYDAIVTLDRAGSYTLHAVAQDGSGQALGVLHTTDVAPVPNRNLPASNGRLLSYAQLRAPAPTTLPDGPVRSFRLPLQGDMSKYVWMVDGQVWPKADPLLVRRGERVHIELTNQTMMWHPMHLHGHFFRLLQGAGELSPLKHTVNVGPGETIQIEFAADNPGNWFFHCHNAFHLEAGMARAFEYQV